MAKKRAIADSSSVIILSKANLLQPLVEVYRIILAESVYREITIGAHSGADACERFVKEKGIRVQNTSSRGYPGTHKLGRGEADTIQLYNEGQGDFIIVDDGAAARYCKREGIPFINALLFPIVLKYAQARTREFCNKAFEDVLARGRYSDKVVTFARKCSKENISFALPE